MPQRKLPYVRSGKGRVPYGATFNGLYAAYGAAGGFGVARRAGLKRPSSGSETGPGKSARLSTRRRPRSGGSRTVVRRRKGVRDAGNMSDYSKVSASYGKRQGYLERQLRIVNSNTEKTTWMWRAMNKVWGSSGYRFLKSVQEGAAGSAVETPCHVWDLTSVNNANGTTAVPASPGQRLQLGSEVDSAAVSWVPLVNQNNLQQWTLQTAPNNNAERMEGGQSYLDWVSVKMLLYAQTTQPTKVQVEICQFTRDELVPAPEAVTQEHSAFWQSMVHRQMWNPILPVNGNYRKYIRVLKSVTVEMDPKETDETSSGRFKEVNMYLKLGRELDYRWKEDDLAGMGAGGIEVQTNVAQNQWRVHPRKRIFLVVRSVSPVALATGSVGGVANQTNAVSYDISITKRHLNLAPNL